MAQELQQSQKKYQDLYNYAPDMYISLDAKTANVIECNQTIINFLGFTKEEIIGAPFLIYIHPKVRLMQKKAYS
jgi:PAS domain S-box-containing protein